MIFVVVFSPKWCEGWAAKRLFWPVILTSKCKDHCHPHFSHVLCSDTQQLLVDQEASCVWNLNHFLSLCVFCCCIIKTQLLLLYFISKGHSKGSTHRIYGEKPKHQMKNWVECSPDLEFVDLCVFWVVWGASGRRYNDSLLKDWFYATSVCVRLGLV